MTATREPQRTTGKLSMAEVLAIFTATGRHPLKFTAYDGSTAGTDDAELGLDLRSPRGATYLATAPGELGLARAYVSGDLQLYGVHPGDPYELLKTLTDRVHFRRPSARVLANVVRSIRIVGQWSGTALRLNERFPEGQDAAVVIEAPDGRIVGAARLVTGGST